MAGTRVTLHSPRKAVGSPRPTTHVNEDSRDILPDPGSIPGGSTVSVFAAFGPRSGGRRQAKAGRAPRGRGMVSGPFVYSAGAARGATKRRAFRA